MTEIPKDHEEQLDNLFGGDGTPNIFTLLGGTQGVGEDSLARHVVGRV